MNGIYDGEIVTNERQILHGKELDIYLPDIKVAIEFNGIYWHSTQFKDKFYHIEKSKLCAAQNIRLIHIYEYEWDLNRELCEHIITNALTQNCSIYKAEDCKIIEISIEESVPFAETYSFDPPMDVIRSQGLYYKENLVAILQHTKNNSVHYISKNSNDTQNIMMFKNANCFVNGETTLIDLSKWSSKPFIECGFILASLLEPVPMKTQYQEIYNCGYEELRYVEE